MRTRVVVFWLAVLALLVPAAGLTFARIAQPDTGFWIRTVAFTPLGIVLYGVTLGALLARLLVVRRARSAVPAVAALAAAGLALHCWWFSPQLTGANPPAADEAETLTVMTANVLQGEADGIGLVRDAGEEGVDVLVVQEITAADLADMERAGLGDLLPHRVGEPRGSGHGTMVFSRTELGEPERIPTLHDGWLVDVDDLTLVAVHPYAPTVPAGWRDDHAAILATVEEADPDLVVGDLNATGDHAPIRALADAGYRDVGELANEGWQPTWPSSGLVDVLGVPLPSLTQIDHVLVGPRLAALTMRTVDLPGSDHRAVVAEVARK